MLSRGLLLRLASAGGGRVGLLVSQLAVNLILAREMLLADYGLFAYVLAVSALVSNFVPLGWPVVALQLISEADAKKDWRTIKGVLVLSVAFTTTCGLLFCMAFLAVWWILPAGSKIGETMFWASFLIPITGTFALLGRVFQAFNRIFWSVYPKDVVAPLVFLSSVMMLGDYHSGPVILQYILIHAVILVSTIVALAVGLSNSVKSAKAFFDLKGWMRRAMTTLVGNLGVYLFERTDQVMIGLFLPLEFVGIYNLAAKLCRLLVVPLQVVNIVFPSMLSVAFNSGDMKKVKRLFGQTLIISGLGALPIFMVFERYPEAILGLFGEEFLTGASVIQILSLGMMIAACTGVTNLGLVMMNDERTFALSALVGAILNVGGNLVLIPSLGFLGAAVSTAVTLSLVNSWQFIRVLSLIKGP